METARGNVSHCQNTSRISGGGNNSAVTTTYIALFRLEQRQVQFSSGSPLPITDGDRVVVAGRPRRGALYADAVHNVTTGFTKHSGILSRVFLAVLLLCIGLIFGVVASGFLGPHGRWVFLGFVAGSLYLLWRAVQTGVALRAVHSAAP